MLSGKHKGKFNGIILLTGALGILLTGCGERRDAFAKGQEEAGGSGIYSLEPMEIYSPQPTQEPDQEPPGEPGGTEPGPANGGGAEPDPSEEPRQTGQDLEEREPEHLTFVDAWGEWFDTDIDPEVQKHGYDWDCLENTEGGISYEGDEGYYIRKGIDVSHHQGHIDWKAVKEEGYEFAILRIGYRGYGQEGKLNVDRTFHDNIKKAKEAGLEVGVYIFSQALNEEEALEEARLVLDNLAPYEVDLPVVYDPELIRDAAARTDDVTGEQFTKNTVVFCEKIKEAGYQPMVYSNMYWEAFLFDMKVLEQYQYPIWYADYEPVPQTPYQFEFWQYTASGRVRGIEGEIDLDIQFCPRD